MGNAPEKCHFLLGMHFYFEQDKQPTFKFSMQEGALPIYGMMSKFQNFLDYIADF
jgi:hypothetical protein